MTIEEFNSLSNFEKLAALGAIPSKAPRKVYLLANDKKMRLYCDSVKYVDRHEHFNKENRFVVEPIFLIIDKGFTIPCLKDDTQLVIKAE